MKTHLFAIRLLLLAPILFGASCAAPTPLPAASQTPPVTQTSTPTAATQTTTPTEIPLPQGPISELQKTLGENYKLTKAKEGDYFVINGIDNLKFNQDGTAELVYSGEALTVAFQAISLDGEKLNIGPWQYNKEGEVTMLSKGSPETEDDVKNLPQLAYLEGHPKEKEIDRTIRLYNQMATAKTATYDPKKEFENEYEDGKKIDFPTLDYWTYYKIKDSDSENIYFEGGQGMWGQLLILDRAYFNMKVYDNLGNVKLDLVNMPVVFGDTDESVFTTTAFIEVEYVLTDANLRTVENRSGYTPNLITKALSEGENNLGSNEFQKFCEEHNKELLAKNVINKDMGLLPQQEFIYLSFFSFLHN